MISVRELWQLAKSMFSDFMEDKALQLAAALSFYTLLSLAPLLILVIGAAGMMFGRDEVSDRMVSEIQVLAGREGAEVAQTILQNSTTPKGNVVSIVVGIVTLLVGATGVFGQLQSSLNQIWEVEARPGMGIRGFIRTRLLSLAMVAGIGFLLLASLVISAVLAAVNKYMADLLPGMGGTLNVVNFAVSLVVVTLLFAMVFKYLPDVQISWRDVWVGAAATGLLFTIGKTLIGVYLGHSGVGSVYGAAGSVVVLIVWVYYSSLIVFMGAEFTQVYARRFGTRIQPSRYAVSTDKSPPSRADANLAESH